MIRKREKETEMELNIVIRQQLTIKVKLQPFTNPFTFETFLAHNDYTLITMAILNNLFTYAFIRNDHYTFNIFAV